MKSIITTTFTFIFALQLNATEILDTVPQTQSIGHMSTTWDDFMTASPSDEITLIKPPSPTETGDANISFPIKLPEARQGHVPEINISYNNEGGTTWLGTGWNLSLSSITLDTRWGVPLYDTQEESEIYLLDGQQLGPVFHRNTKYTRETDRTFTLRQEGSFQKIFRHGNSPKNYWWEIRQTDGRVSYYGGEPSSGSSSAYAIKTKDGNITEWLLVKTLDVYQNLITYQYQEENYLGGSNKYPRRITYNGQGNTEGNYSIDFELSSFDRQDRNINCRTGMIRALADLLGKITVKYKDQTIRSYELDYEKGPFEKTLLKGISEKDEDGALFYNYTFDYHDSVTNGDDKYNLWRDDAEKWSVAKDNLDVNPVTATELADFLESPTIIGGAKSVNAGGGVAVTIGFVAGNPASKENTIGVNGGGFTSNGTGVISLVDINGDGLPDKVWKENGKLFYRANQESGLNGVSDFGNKHEIIGIKDFSKSNTISWNVGGELNLGVGSVGGFVGYSHEENNTKITTYFADFNGDELLDIAHDKVVYFNTINSDGHPVFTQNSLATASPIYEGEAPSPPVVDPDDQAALESSFPLHDAVRIWEAPFTGNINITAAFNLVAPTDQEALDNPNRDGVIVMIQRDETELFRQTIDESDYTPHNPNNVGNVQVNANDLLYFRVHSRYNGYGDQVNWDPVITYIGEDPTETDVNDLPYYQYQASEDFLLSAPASYVLTADGTVSIKADFFKPALTDSVFIRFRGGIELDTAFAPSVVFDDAFEISDIPVTANSDLTISMFARSNVDWSAIDFRPTIEYTEFTDGSPAYTNDGTPFISFCPVVDFQTYNVTFQPGEALTAPEDGLMTVVLTNEGLALPPQSSYFTLKSEMNPDSLVFVDNTSMVNGNQYILEMEVVQDEILYADLNALNSDDFDLLGVQFENMRCQYVMSGDSTEFDCGVYARNSENKNSGHHYRGWGQFAYNANDGRGGNPIIVGDLEIDEDAVAGDTTLIGDESDPDDVEGNNVNIDDLFVVMSPDSKSMAWRGSDALTFINPTQIGSSRNGRQDVDLNTTTIGVAGAFPTIDLETKSYNNAVAAGGSAGSVGAGGGVAPGVFFSKVDLTDMNGDRYPDHIYEDRIEYTNNQGGLSTEDHNISSWGIHEAESLAYGGGIGGSYVRPAASNSGAGIGKGSNKKTTRKRAQGKSKLGGSRNAFKSSRGSVGVSGNYTKDDDSTNHTFMDINGDGLEDKVWSDGMVALNIGYEFASKMAWGFEGIRGGDANDWGAGIGYNFMNGSILAGFSGSRTDSRSEFGFTDINDDALVDKIVSTNPMVVKINTGDGFSEEITLNNNDELDAGYSIGESLNLAGTVCFPVFFIRVCVNPSTSVGGGTSSVGTSISDINGDGYADILSAHTDDSHLYVKESIIGATNMLKTIHYPMNGQLDITYVREGNTQQMPFSKWVIAGYEAYDGVAGDGIDTYRHNFEYDNPNYDRHERQFLGFETVEDQHISGSNVRERTIVSTFHTEDIYRQGLVKDITIRGKDFETYQITNYDYAYRDITTGIELPPSFANSDEATIWPTLDKMTVISTEGQTDQNLKRTYSYTYDQYGNELSVIDQDDAGSVQETVKTYQYDTDKYLFTNPITEANYGDGQLYRMTENDRDEIGNILQVREKLDDNTSIITDFTYDDYGNVLTITNPANYRDQRLTFERKYDDEEHQYMTYEKDGYGYEETFTYEYLHNELIASTDHNGNLTEYTIDNRGRATSITYPKEIAAGIPYSVSFTYNPDAATGYALSQHYDSAQEGTLDVIQFEDGLQRAIQTKVKSSIFANGQVQDMYIVSGTEKYDGLGRKTQTHLPLTEPISSGFVLNTKSDTAFSTVTYDVFDRPIEVVDPYGGKTTFEYTLDNTRSGQLALATKKTNPLNDTEHDYFNTRGSIIAERFDGPDGDIWREYQYDGYSQVKGIYDHFGNETSYTYDMVGRRVSVKVPDAGTTELVYDNANNLIERITATIRDVISEDGSIRYQYDHERLVQIDYPKHFQNKVQIHYGAPQDSFNRAGRIWLQEDATGGREYFFDVNGNPTKEIRTVMINRSKVFTYVSEAEYDTWGRVMNYKYADGESLDYTYNNGGLLTSMVGTKNERETTYLTLAGYDKFSDRTYLEYGNKTKDWYSYDDKGRLVNRLTKLGNGSTALEETYTYDLADNLKTKANSSKGTETMGGSTSETYEYDILHRMILSSGTWNDGTQRNDYSIDFGYDELNNLTVKDQFHNIDDEMQVLTSRGFIYEYEHTAQPTRPSNVGGKDFFYDPNGNLLLSNSQAIFNYDQNVFDEENRLQGTSNNGYISRYTYDGFGKRTLKSHGEFQGVFINGAPAGFLEHKTNFRVDLSPYFTVFEDDYRKHYFIDGMRILSKIGTGLFQTTIANGPEITAGGIDYKSRIQQYEQSILDYYGSLEVSPGPPTLLAFLGQPENNENSLPDANTQNPYNNPPPNWPNISPPDTTGPPGTPIFYVAANINNANVPAGYNFTAGQIAQEVEQFYFHYDNNGSTEYVTDLAGDPRQYAIFLPSGERWIHQTTTDDETPYMYTGLQFDEESGMYDLGNIYYDPITNVEQSIDPTLQNFGNSTFKQRDEGQFYYDYEENNNDDDPTFDNEILNSEKPDPFLSDVATTEYMDDGTNSEKYQNQFKNNLLTYKDVMKELGGNEVGWDQLSLDFDGNPFAPEIKAIVPHLVGKGKLTEKQFRKLVNEVIVEPRRKVALRKGKRDIKRKFSGKGKKVVKKRRVRF